MIKINAPFFKGMFLAGLVLGLAAAQGQIKALYDHPAADAYPGWRLAVQAYSFNRYTFFEAVDKAASLGLDWIEAYPGQRVSAERPDAIMNADMPAAIRWEVQKKLKDAGVRLINFGVVGLPNDEAACRQVFDFAKVMGIETIVSEPPEDALDLVDRLCREYQIRVAIHNHPKPSAYWNPETVLKAVQGRSRWIGACCDTGHWMRSGIHPLDGLKMLEGRIVSLHLKDLNLFGDPKNAHDVVWGTGKADIQTLLAELDRQGFKGPFSIEYEYNWTSSVPEIRRCVEYFNATAGALKTGGYRDLFTDDLSNCVVKPGTWTVEEGILTWKGGGYLWTKDRYGNFILNLEYKVSPGANSGIFFRTGDLKDIVQTGIEVQIHETGDGNPRGVCGAIYDCLVPAKQNQKKAGEWNHLTILCKDNVIQVVQNGEQVIDMNLDLWTEPHKNPDGTPNKFNTAFKDMPREGHIGFQDHGQPVWFRNVKIKTL